MRGMTRGLVRALVAALLICAGSAEAMTPAERATLDLDAYHVTDSGAGLFDLAARRAELAATTNPLLRKQIASIGRQNLCPSSRQLPVVDGAAVVPRFYEDRTGWRQGAVPFQNFENLVSKLAGQQVVAPQRGAGACLIDMLARWASADAFMDVAYLTSGLQTWFQVESSLFAAAVAYAIVRDDVPGRDAEKRQIEAWLVAAANNHLRYEGGVDGTCCNNHFYRRALYALMIGILAKDDALFRIGISAVYSALSDAGADGSLRLEMMRKENSAKYQVYAVMHLVLLARIAERQGYDLFGLTAYGHSLSDVVDFAVANLLRPETSADAALTPRQDTAFLADDQYYAWLELIAGAPQWRDAARSLLAGREPVYNRGLGGYLSLYFMPVDDR